MTSVSNYSVSDRSVYIVGVIIQITDLVGGLDFSASLAGDGWRSRVAQIAPQWSVWVALART